MDPDRYQGKSRRMYVVIAALVIILVIIPLSLNAFIVDEPVEAPTPQVILDEPVIPAPLQVIDDPIIPQCEGVSIVSEEDELCISENTYHLAVINDGEHEIAGLYVSLEGEDDSFYKDLPFSIEVDQLHHGKNEYNTSIGEVQRAVITPFVVEDANRYSCPSAAIKYQEISQC